LPKFLSWEAKEKEARKEKRREGQLLKRLLPFFLFFATACSVIAFGSSSPFFFRPIEALQSTAAIKLRD
jgi:hypothetical protein